MKKQIIRNLKRLASLHYQQRYCVAATADEYAIPVDLYEQARSAIKLALSAKNMSRNLSIDEQVSLKLFLNETEAYANNIPFDDPNVSTTFLIEKSSEWANVRVAARRCLRELGCIDDLSSVTD